MTSIDTWKGQKIKRALVRKNLASEVPINPGGRGKRFKLLELTASGRELLAGYQIKPSTGHGRGGVAHQWWVRAIASWLAERGISAEIEDASQGARVDLTFTEGSTRTAVEIEMSEGHALENIRKDIAAGFESVVTLFDDPRAVKRLEAKLEDEIPPGVQIGHLSEFGAHLGAILAPSITSVRAPNQNQEPRRRRRRVRRPAPTPAPQVAESRPQPDIGALATPLAAEYLGLSPATLETMRTRGGGPPFLKLGRRVVYRPADLDSWLDERRRTSTSDPGGEAF